MRIIALFLVSIALAFVSYQLYLTQVKLTKVQADMLIMESNGAKALAEAESKARKAEIELSETVARIRKETNEEITALRAQRDDLLKRVRRAEANAATALLLPRPGDFASDRQVASGDPGAELPGTLGEQDVLEAYRADTIREHLIACYQHYDSARKLNGHNEQVHRH